jgi:hypothetical protein
MCEGFCFAVTQREREREREREVFLLSGFGPGSNKWWKERVYL